MTVYIERQAHILPDGSTVLDAVAALSPFGADQTIVTLNGVRIDADSDVPLSEGDALAFFPLLIGG